MFGEDFRWFEIFDEVCRILKTHLNLARINHSEIISNLF